MYLPRNGISSYQDDRYLPMIDSDEENIITTPKVLSFIRHERSSAIHPRAHRNAWFRVSTYQHFKPSASEEPHNSDHLMRWG